ncbi:YidB family protein [Aerolutibacter daejeonensis]|uniref:YidB family protein n=1 Tax=Aerolutibacter daejeonensis TaxID=346181 RepID=UPI00068BAACE|nr:YidB family protein [Lysobacter daejeonensis]
MYEKIVEQAAADFGVDQHQVKKVLGEMIGLAFNPKHGGPEGFLQAFREVGLGDVVSSWLGHGQNRPITARELEAAVGPDALQAIATHAGLPVQTVGDLAAAMLPDAVDVLSEQGELPAPGLLDKLREWFGDMGEGWGHIERWRRGGM